MPNLEPESEKTTLIEEGSELKGTLSSSCTVVVRGKIEGDLTSPSVSIAATGAVHGRVKVRRFVSEGELSGELDAETVELSGVVKDHTVIRARSLSVKLSPERGRMALVFGECSLEVGEPPSKEAAVAKASEGPAAAKAPASSEAAKASSDPASVGSNGAAEPAAQAVEGARSQVAERHDCEVQAVSASARFDGAAALVAAHGGDDAEPPRRKRS